MGLKVWSSSEFFSKKIKKKKTWVDSTPSPIKTKVEIILALLYVAVSIKILHYNFELLQELQEEYQEFGIQLNLIESLEDSFIAE